jgi:hypothetical protein
MIRAIELLMAISVVTGCTDASAHKASAAGVALSGRWTVSYAVDSNVVWHDRVHAAAQGTITLMSNHTVGRDYPRIGVPATYGVYDVDFSPWGFAPAGSALPAIVGGSIGDDSVEIRFDSDRRDFEMTMDGTLRGDTVRGRWIASSARAILGHGEFTMYRAGPRE